MKTITESAKKSITEHLNRLLQVEYNMIFSYPRVIDRLARDDRIEDKQFVKPLEQLVKESIHHFDVVNNWIVKLGGETIWNIGIVSSSVDAGELLLQQLEKETLAISWYKATKTIAEQNIVEAGGLVGKLTGTKDILPEDYVNVDELISMLDQHIADEERHTRIAKDSSDRLSMLGNE
ncbi:ferritin-like domain-containing protein [Chloroflexota bacterium]